MNNILNKLSKGQKIGMVIIALCLIVACAFGIYKLNEEKTIALTPKTNKAITLEYGEKYDFSFENLVSTKGLSKSEMKVLKAETTIKNPIKNIKGKDYPQSGTYQITVSYNKQEFVQKITVKKEDTKKIEAEKQAQAEADAKAKAEADAKAKAEAEAKAQAQTTAPTNTGNNRVICIDPGHQARANNNKEPNGPGSSVMKAKVTGGATGVVTGSLESQINLDTALKLKSILTQRGYKVIMCRETQNVDISNAQRAEIANNANAAAFIRIHCDSSDSSSPTGTMTMAPSTSNRYCSSIAQSSQRLSRCILDSTCASAGSRSRGVSITDTMTGLNWAKVPVTIIEMGFLSNPNEDRLLSSSDYQTKLATGIANGIDSFCK